MSQAQQRRLRTYAANVERAFGLAFGRLANVDDTAAARWVEWAAPNIEAAQRGAALGQQAYVATFLRLLGEAAGEPVELDTVIGPALRSGTPTAEVYHRPVVTARTALAEGQTWAEAMGTGARKAASLALTDVGTSARVAGQRAMANGTGVVGYRRVPAGGACRWCLLIATRRYHIEELAPAHTHCTCSVMPVTGSRDPGAVLEKRALAALKVNDDEAAAELLTMSATAVETETGLSTPPLAA
jgi:hypothetical protein